MWEHPIFTKSMGSRKNGAVLVKKHCKNGLMLCVFCLQCFPREKHQAIAFGLHLQREMKIQATAGNCAFENTKALFSAENWGLGFSSGRNAAHWYGFLGQIKGI